MTTWQFGPGLALLFKNDYDPGTFYDLAGDSMPLMTPRDRALAMALMRRALKELEAQDE